MSTDADSLGIPIIALFPIISSYLGSKSSRTIFARNESGDQNHNGMKARSKRFKRRILRTLN